MDIDPNRGSCRRPVRSARPERERGRPSRLWSSLVAGWTRHLDRRIDEDLRWFDLADSREDIRRDVPWLSGRVRLRAIR